MKHLARIAPITLLSSALLLSACGGGGGGGGSPTLPPAATPGSIQFETTTATVTEGAAVTTVTFNVTRTGGSDGAVSVTIDRTGTATAGTDYTISSTTVSFAAGDAASKTLTVTLADDSVIEPVETLTLTLSAPTGGATIGANAAATLTISDNDGGKPPPPPPPQASIQFDRTLLTVVEGGAAGATVTLDVTRTGASDGAVSVTILQSGTATEGADYTVENPTVTFAAGDTAIKTVTISVADDAALELDETLTLTLSAPTGGVIGTNAAATLTIEDNDVPPAPAMNEATSSVKQLTLSWLKSDGATSYQLLESPDGDDAFTPVPGVELGADATTVTLDIAVHGIDWPNAKYKVGACFQQRCSTSNAVGVANAMLTAIGRFTGSHTNQGDELGFAVAISGDGKTLAIGTPVEDSQFGGIGNCGEDTLEGQDSGAVYVFVRDAQAQWSEQECIKADNSNPLLAFGSSVALSNTGDVLAVGAPLEDTLADNSGAAYVFVRDSQQQWSQQTMVKASNAGSDDDFGSAVALSGEGSTLAVGAKDEDSKDIGDIDNDLVESAGAVYVFQRLGQNWLQQKVLKAQIPAIDDFFGTSVALDATGKTLVIGVPNDDTNAHGSYTPAIDNSGAAYVFVQDQTGAWVRQSVLKAENAADNDHFGFSVAVSADGSFAAAGARDQDGDDELGGIAVDTGAAYVFERASFFWRQRAFLLADKVDIGLAFGSAVALSEHGDFLAVGAPGEDLGLIDTDPEIANSGAAYVFARFEDDFFPLSRVKAKDPQSAPLPPPGFGFGMSIGLSADGSALAVGAPQQDTSSGAAFLY